MTAQPREPYKVVSSSSLSQSPSPSYRLGKDQPKSRVSTTSPSYPVRLFDCAVIVIVIAKTEGSPRSRRSPKDLDSSNLEGGTPPSIPAWCQSRSDQIGFNLGGWCTTCLFVKFEADYLIDASLTSLIEGTFPHQNEVEERLQLSQVELEQWAKT
jgi:hypothetical protein